MPITSQPRRSEAVLSRKSRCLDRFTMIPRFQTIPTLDGIRAVAVLIVMLSHAGFGERIPGGFGVTIFFFLSGYLITSLLLHEFAHTETIDVRSFYIRRFFRLVPPLMLTLVIAYGLVAAGLLPGGITLYGALSQIFYFANYYAIYEDFVSNLPAGTVILWSLAIEEHFYILYPLVMLGLLSANIGRRRTGLVFFAICIAVLLWRTYLAVQPGFNPARTYFGTDTRIDSILYGSLLALWSNPMNDLADRGRMSPLRWAIVAGALGVLLFTFIYRSELFRETLRYSLQGMALYPLFYYAIRFHDNVLFRPLNWLWVSRIGIWSYSIYLVHFIIIKLVAAQWEAVADKPFVLFAISAVVSVVYAVFIDRWIDPVFRRRGRSTPDTSARKATLSDLPQQQ